MKDSEKIEVIALYFPDNIKYLFLIITEILAIWFLVLVLYTQKELFETFYGTVLFFLAVASVSLIVFNYFLNYVSKGKNPFLIVKQINTFLFFTIVFLTIYNFNRDAFNSDFFYENPVDMSYVFILVYLFSFYMLKITSPYTL